MTIFSLSVSPPWRCPGGKGKHRWIDNVSLDCFIIDLEVWVSSFPDNPSAQHLNDFIIPLAGVHWSEFLVANKTREWMVVKLSRNGSVFWKTSWKTETSLAWTWLQDEPAWGVPASMVAPGSWSFCDCTANRPQLHECLWRSMALHPWSDSFSGGGGTYQLSCSCRLPSWVASRFQGQIHHLCRGVSERITFSVTHPFSFLPALPIPLPLNFFP